MPRYVILTHDFPVLHWDLMLETGPVLRTWRLAEPPVAGRPIAMKPLPDHRLMYLDYEGAVSGDRGAVTRWDHGVYEVDVDTGIVLHLRLTGTRLNHHVILTIAGTSSGTFILGEPLSGDGETPKGDNEIP